MADVLRMSPMPGGELYSDSAGVLPGPNPLSAGELEMFRSWQAQERMGQLYQQGVSPYAALMRQQLASLAALQNLPAAKSAKRKQLAESLSKPRDMYELLMRLKLARGI